MALFGDTLVVVGELSSPRLSSAYPKKKAMAVNVSEVIKIFLNGALTKNNSIFFQENMILPPSFPPINQLIIAMAI
jgi:hypothetical protein